MPRGRCAEDGEKRPEQDAGPPEKLSGTLSVEDSVKGVEWRQKRASFLACAICYVTGQAI